MERRWDKDSLLLLCVILSIWNCSRRLLLLYPHLSVHSCPPCRPPCRPRDSPSHPKGTRLTNHYGNQALGVKLGQSETDSCHPHSVINYLSFPGAPLHMEPPSQRAGSKCFEWTIRWTSLFVSYEYPWQGQCALLPVKWVYEPWQCLEITVLNRYVMSATTTPSFRWPVGCCRGFWLQTKTLFDYMFGSLW